MPKLSLPVRPRRGVAAEAGSTEPLPPTTVPQRRPTLLIGLAALIAVLLLLLLTVILPALRGTPTASSGALGPVPRPSPGAGGSATAPPSPAPGSAGAGSVVRDPFAMQYDANSTAPSSAPSPALGGSNGLGGLPGSGGVVTYPGSGSAGGGTLPLGPAPVATQPAPTSGGGSTAPPGGTTASPTPAPAPAPITHTSVQLTAAPAPSGSSYQASFIVDGGTRYVATAGSTFAGSLIFRSVQTAADGTLYAVLQYAGHTPFDIHAGQTVKLSG